MEQTNSQPSKRSSVRLLILGWCIWLLTMWSLLGWNLSISEVAVRWLVLFAAMGMLGIWPAFRLSQFTSPTGVLLDWAAMNIVWQAVVWPLMPISGWSVEQVAWQSGALASWSLVTGLWIAIGGESRHSLLRLAAMGLCILWIVGEPLLMMGCGQNWDMRISPIAVLWATTAPAGDFDPQRWAGPIVTMAAASIATWIGLSGYLLGLSRRGR